MHAFYGNLVSMRMIEVTEKDPQESSNLPKKVLVYFSERREVTFFSRSAKEGNVVPLLDAVGDVFADVLPSKNPTQQLTVQMKNEN